MPWRQELARHFGAEVVGNVAAQDPVEALMVLTHRQGVDAAVEALGAQSTFEACVTATRPGGIFAHVGDHGHGEYVTIPRMAWGLGLRDQTLRTALDPGGQGCMQRLLRRLERGRVDPTPLSTHPFGCEDLAKAFQRMDTKEDAMITPLITLHAAGGV